MKNKTPYLLLLPQILLSISFVLGILNGFVQSFGMIESLGLNTPTLQYYKELFTREDFISSLLFSIYISVVSSILSIVIGVLICDSLVRIKYTKGFFARIIELPIIVPHIVVAFFVIHFLTQNGLVARIFFHLGIIGAKEQFPLAVFDRRGIGIIVAYLWKEVPFIVYFVMALMKSIDEKLGEAAINLGANKITVFLKITLPLCLPTIIGAFMIIFTYTLGAYELPFILGATTPKTLPILAYIQYTHPDLHNRPYAMAMNGIIVMISALSVTLWAIFGRKNEKI